MLDSLFKIWLLSVFFVGSLLEGATPLFDWSDRVSTYRAYWDDPRPLLAEGKTLLATLDPAKEPIRWLQVFCAYGMANDAIHQMPEIDQHLQTAKAIAAKYRLWEWMIDVLIIEGSFVESLNDRSPAAVIAIYGRDAARPYEEALALAEKHQSLRNRYLVIRNFMSYLWNSGQSTRVLELLTDAPNDIRNIAALAPIDRLNLKKNLNFIYKIANQDQKLRVLHEELVEECESLSLRTFCSYTFYEYGVLFSTGRVPVDFPRALKAFKKAEAMARELDDESILSMTYSRLSLVSQSLEKYEESLQYARLAAEIARKNGHVATLADAGLSEAETLRRLNRPWDAVSVLTRLQSELPDTLYRHRANLQQKLAEIHEGLGQWRAAFDARTLEMHFEKKFLEERGQENFSEQMVKLGLQLEQEKNKALTSENELRERERKTILYGGLAVIIIALFLLLGLIWVSSKNREIRKLQHYIETQVLQRFLPPKIVGDILSGKSHFEQEAQTRMVTVLFADLVSFTESAERMRPQDLTAVLNRFFAAMSEVVFEHGGVIDKFIGDAIMVVFGAPHDMTTEEQADRSTRCAQQMQEQLQVLNRDWLRDFQVSFAMRIGLHQGSGVVGTFGSEKRSDYTVIGHTVNLASRIESQALPNQILVSESIARFLPQERRSHAGSFRLKGIEHPVTLYALCEAGQDPAFRKSS